MAIAIGLKLAKPVGRTETIPLLKARQRVCAVQVHARLPLPNFNNSAMDGYAVNTSQLTAEGPYRLPVTGRVAAGDAGTGAVAKPGPGAIRILTGAVVPEAYDAVIMQEKCQLDDGHIHFERRPPKGNNIRLMGEDCAPGNLVAAKGTHLQSHHACLLAAQGLAEVSVFRKVRVAFFSTGSELRQPGETLAAGQIYNSNRFALAMQLDLPFIETVDLGTLPDDPDRLKQALADASDLADVVVTTGGVSVGDEDHMPRLVTELGGRIHVMKVAIKPGKPVTIGTIGDAVFIGLPGNPVAAFLNQLLIGRPIIDKLAGLDSNPLPTQTVVAGFDRESRTQRQEYVLARVADQDRDGLPIVEVFKKSGSAALLPLANSDGFVVLPAGLAQVSRGDRLQFIAHQ